MEAPERNKHRALDLNKSEWSFYLIKVVENKPLSAWTDLASLVIQSLNNVKYLGKNYALTAIFLKSLWERKLFLTVEALIINYKVGKRWELIDFLTDHRYLRFQNFDAWILIFNFPFYWVMTFLILLPEHFRLLITDHCYSRDFIC